MRHRADENDRRFREDFEAGLIAPADFDHPAHVRLAYVYLADNDVETAHALMKEALLAYLRHLDIDPARYSETITRAWVLAVRHFADRCEPCASAAEFISRNPRLLDSRIMLSHYSAELLFSDRARARFQQPDLEPIPDPPEATAGD